MTVDTQDKLTAGQGVPRLAQWLGLAGLLPQAIAVGLAIYGGAWGWIALAAGFGYAALIFSFLGGVWFGQGIRSALVSPWVYPVSVLPSLIALGLYLPWTFGADWPGPSLLWLGLFLCLSPLVDRALKFEGPEWLALRWRLSLGLGGMTIVLALLAMDQY
ncbi:DUF3429 family protein [Erythrobacter jejuensis]|uniref:DUF3429 family protein n=2 Tax=Parerythrobacter jejuensis TaxID=795812 RepID=A0A845AS21_9SPHN|nr:DUF3429 family protein [Parerythrobacter jejuensis]